MAIAMQQASTYNEGRTTALQHARVALERIDLMLTTAYAAPNHPGAAVYVDTLGTYRYPDTLIVWHPAGGTPVNAAGPPLISECIFYCWDPSAPTNLIELTAPSNNSTIPLDSTLQTTAWRSTLNALKTASSSKKTVLTTLLRTASVSSGSGSLPTGMANLRGAVRFELTVTPSAATYSSYLAGNTTWANLPWPAGMYGSQFGLRQIWLRCELQLTPSVAPGQAGAASLSPIAFFGSSVLTDQMTP
jgi:hypothetical protein